MKALFSSAAAWWDGRSLRERRMLAVMGALALGVVGWLGVVQPLDGWQADQARARVAAADIQDNVFVRREQQRHQPAHLRGRVGTLLLEVHRHPRALQQLRRVP